jgi:hypothetical protein
MRRFIIITASILGLALAVAGIEPAHAEDPPQEPCVPESDPRCDQWPWSAE